MDITPVKFDIYDGDRIVRTEILSEAAIKIGKLSSSHVRLDDDSVSRMHAVVEDDLDHPLSPFPPRGLTGASNAWAAAPGRSALCGPRSPPGL